MPRLRAPLFALSILTAFAAVILVGTPARAQSRPPGAVAVHLSARDSIALHTGVVSAVQSYEWAAYHFLSPVAFGVGCNDPDHCRVGVCVPRSGGRFCLMGRESPCAFNDSAESRVAYGSPCADGARVRWPESAPRDFPTIQRELEALLAKLDSAGAKLPGDAWIAGQRVWYLLFAGLNDRALNAAAACKADRGWCLQLQGYIFARERDEESATATFARARAALSPDARCKWEDISLLLDDRGLYDRYTHMACGSAERTAFEKRFWWLSDPSWTIPGNDRYIEHLAREIERRITVDWGGTICGSCAQGPFMNAVTQPDEGVRVGPSDSWIAELPQPCSGGTYWGGTLSRKGSSCRSVGQVQTAGWFPGVCVAAIGLSSIAHLHFTPNAHAVLAPLSARDSDWNLAAGPPTIGQNLSQSGPLGGPRDLDSLAGAVPTDTLPCNPAPLPERFTPLYAAEATQLVESQTAFFRRRDSALVIAAFDATKNRLIARHADGTIPWAATLFAFAHFDKSGLPHDSVVAHLDGKPHAQWVTTTIAPWDSLLLGFELLISSKATSGGAMARARFGVAPPPEQAQRVRLSDILFYDAAVEAPQVLQGPDGALTHALGTTSLGSRSKVGIFWEEYGLLPSDTGDVTVTVTPLDAAGGALSRLGALVGRGTGNEPVHLTFSDPPRVGRADTAVPNTRGRAVSLDLSGLVTGHYAVALTLTVRGQQPVTVVREFTTAR